MSLSTLALYNQPEYSDVTIQFSDRTVYCHKLILCTNSDYFKKLCGPGSHFAESNSKVVELKEDDPDAVEHILRYIYSGKHNTNEDDAWHLQLEIAKSAEKYLLPTLAAAALSKFRNVASAVSEPEEVFATMMHIRQSTLDSRHLQVAQDLETLHLLDLLKVSEYRELIDQDKSIMWNYLDQFRDFMSSQEEVVLATCDYCRKKIIMVKGSHLRHGCINLITRDYTARRLWIPKDELQAFQALLLK